MCEIMLRKMQIGERWVGEGEPCFIVAEAGSNHNGNFEQVLRLIDVAVQAGADAVKFQTFKASRMYPKSAGRSDYLRVNRSIYEIIREMEMPEDWIPRIAEYCRQCKIEFMSSPFDEISADLLEPYVNAYKIASYEITHVPLLQHIAHKKKPIIISTGTATLEEAKSAADVLRDKGNDRTIFLQCTASYPTPIEAVNARAMLSLQKATGSLTGLSDHSRDPVVAPMTAVALGACIVEKHFTLSNRLPGPDHQFALEPDELSEMIQRVRQVEQALGHGRKEVLPIEKELHAFARRSIFAIQDIERGEKLTSENIAVLRCGKLGFGLSPKEFEVLLGRKATHPIAKESLISVEDV